MIDYKVMPSAKFQQAKYSPTLESSGYQQQVSEAKWVADTLETQEMLDKIFEICVEMGADALIDFKILDTSDEYIQTTIHGIRITGLANKLPRGSLLSFSAAIFMYSI